MKRSAHIHDIKVDFDKAADQCDQFLYLSDRYRVLVSSTDTDRYKILLNLNRFMEQQIGHIMPEPIVFRRNSMQDEKNTCANNHYDYPYIYLEWGC